MPHIGASLAMHSLAIGVTATAAMDLWLLGLKTLGVPTLDFALLGRWVGHAVRGRFIHRPIAASARLPAEAAIGWGFHYLTGVVFAMAFVLLAGAGEGAAPRLGLAVVFGLATVMVPWCVMQPAMGAGFASRRTRTPARNALRNLANHGVFGLGLHAGAWIVHAMPTP